ncbi:putative inner membrane transporter YedA [Corallococcus coralloides]|uniref:Putative inner membrane transporter YedA n=1 Tax=Corallococcus coralloides TaxID=184914 RepID=A0A410S2S8_CORCK|nr:drug/metabolite exporter YedA [Corallococcus coralloides]QAT88474.1 putative inner membrane transporter YedA [Corallococcus coralloides]
MTTATVTPDLAEPSPHRGRLLFSLFALYVIWGSTYLAMRFALTGFPPFRMAGMRFLLAGGVLFAGLRLKGQPGPGARQWGAGVVTGFLLLVLGNGGIAVAQNLGVPSGVAALVVGSMPLWAAIFGAAFGQRPGRAELAGLVLGFAGVALLNLGGDMSGGGVAALAVVVAPAAWAFGSVWSRRLPMPSGLMAPATQMLSAGVMMMALSFALGERMADAVPPRAMVSFVYLLVFGSLVAFSAYGYLLKHARPALAMSYAYVNPAVAVLLGVVFAGETLGPMTWGAMSAILVAVMLLARGKR